jgi:hypothetical protein
MTPRWATAYHSSHWKPYSGQLFTTAEVAGDRRADYSRDTTTWESDIQADEAT